ncbi:MAG: hypothetical protein QMC81_08360 [Thermoanaerobacterales bacterium]|nr:hypothetical protein [Thermoanaerobacterales bacterium]
MLPEPLRDLFRNYHVRTIDPDRAAELVIRTTLARGSWEQIEWLFGYYGAERIREVFMKDYYGRRELPEPTRCLWALAFLGEAPARETDPRVRWRGRRRVPPHSPQ